MPRSAHDALLREIAAAPATVVVLIDGPSGAGKSTLADELIETWSGARAPQLVRLDDIYPGWNGLDAGARHVTQFLLGPRGRGESAAWQRWDWGDHAPAEWHTVDSDRPVIVEGCGALAKANAALSDIRIWLDADDEGRKMRALERDGGAFDAFWDQWQDEWDEYCRRENPAEYATTRLFSRAAD